jgi:uncharacterized protein YndB with AHSA1/START domain
MPSLPDDRVFRISRFLPFSPEAVFSAFAKPESLASWWGPDGFTNSFAVFEFRVGGRWTFVMHGPDGQDYPNTNRFTVLDPAERVVIRHDGEPYFTLTVELAAVPGGTELTWVQAFDSPCIAQAVRTIVVPANEQNLDRLTRCLAAATDAA